MEQSTRYPDARWDRFRDWINELRSGRYQQTHGFLGTLSAREHNRPGHCCVGVACVLAEIPVIIRDGTLQFGDNRNGATAPDELWLWLGIPRDHLWTPFFNHLYSMNDELGKSFVEIADHIERLVLCNPSLRDVGLDYELQS